MDSDEVLLELPREFGPRFVIGRLITLLPVFASILIFVALAAPTKFWILLGAFTIVFVASALMFIWWTLPSVKRAYGLLGRDALNIARRDGPRSHVLPMVGAVLIMGVVYSVIRQSWHWFVIIGAIGGLFAVGLLLRWVIYDRWILNLLESMPGMARFQQKHATPEAMI